MPGVTLRSSISFKSQLIKIIIFYYFFMKKFQTKKKKMNKIKNKNQMSQVQATGISFYQISCRFSIILETSSFFYYLCQIRVSLYAGVRPLHFQKYYRIFYQYYYYYYFFEMLNISTYMIFIYIKGGQFLDPILYLLCIG